MVADSGLKRLAPDGELRTSRHGSKVEMLQAKCVYRLNAFSLQKDAKRVWPRPRALFTKLLKLKLNEHFIASKNRLR